jgi:hypothetical protein
MLLKYPIVVCLFSILAGIAPIDAVLPGFVEGHLKIISPKEVELEDGSGTTKTTAENYVDYPLVVLNRDGKQEIARVNADTSGNYRVELPPGNYILDLPGRAPKRARATPRPFTIVAGQTVRVDMEIDTGIR